MLADAAMKLEAARQLTYAAAAQSERAMAGEKVADLTFFSACKCFASDVGMESPSCLVRPHAIAAGRAPDAARTALAGPGVAPYPS
jgi:hypothetical protein